MPIYPFTEQKLRSSVWELLKVSLPLSLPPPGTNWADWSNALGREIYLWRALAKLNLELLCESEG
jgi:hypothetical protein